MEAITWSRFGGWNSAEKLGEPGGWLWSLDDGGGWEPSGLLQRQVESNCEKHMKGEM